MSMQIRNTIYEIDHLVYMSNKFLLIAQPFRAEAEDNYYFVPEILLPSPYGRGVGGEGFCRRNFLAAGWRFRSKYQSRVPASEISYAVTGSGIGLFFSKFAGEI